MSGSYGNPPQWQRPELVATPQGPRKKHRVFLWIFLALQVLFLIWVILAAGSGSGTPEDCGTLDQQTCNDAENAGTAIGVGLLILLWAAMDVILGISYAIYRIAKRP
ncbi:hypothetical protein [Streptomyces sp. NE5-10]|uniref:hypothetical protein n=1 Tax=Streptomyces sp. NE5-10 TaxID=2759674 RepID=UPI001F5BE984|nr:hypothetical protein [Streptomyces sp. NE5-10]